MYQLTKYFIERGANGRFTETELKPGLILSVLQADAKDAMAADPNVKMIDIATGDHVIWTRRQGGQD